MSDRRVNVHCTAVPDGAVTVNRKVTLRLSAVLWPEPVTTSGQVGLTTWPSDIASDEARFKLSFFDAQGQLTKTLPLRPDAVTRGARREAAALWRDVVTDLGADPEGFDVLYDVLDVAKAVDANAVVVDAGTLDQLSVGPSSAPTRPKFDITEYAHGVLTDTLTRLHVREAAADTLTALASQATGLKKTILDTIKAGQTVQFGREAADRLKDPLHRAWRLDLWRNTYSGELFGMRPLGDAASSYGSVLKLQQDAAEGGRASERKVLAERAGLAEKFAAEQESRLVDLTPQGQARRDQSRSARADNHFLRRRTTTLLDEKPADSADALAALLMLDTSPEAVHPERDLLQTNLAALDQALRPRFDESVQPPSVEDPKEIARDLMRRKVAGLEGHPTLRKLMNLIVDFEAEVGLDDLGTIFTPGDAGRFRGYVTLAFDPTGSGNNTSTSRQTAIVLQPGIGRAPTVFEPGGEAEFLGGPGPRSDAGSPTVKDGVVQLRDTTRRYRLETADPVSAALKMQSAANATHELDRKGANPD